MVKIKPFLLPAVPLFLLVASASPVAATQQRGALPYDFGPADALLQAELGQLSGNVAVIVRQWGREIFSFQAGNIDFETRTRMASLTKTISAAVMLDTVEDGLVDLDERLGDVLPQFAANGLGEPTLLDCWAMRHGIDARQHFELLSPLSHALSVTLIGRHATVRFLPGEELGYAGEGMQVAGYIAAQRSGLAWGDLAAQRIFGPLSMGTSDYLQFAPNPAVAGGMRSTALDLMNFAQMTIDQGRFRGRQVLTKESIEQLFTNRTRGLPVDTSPFPVQHTDYPYGTDPDYGFGSWVLAENPVTGHVEEILAAGAWGSFLWLDRRRGITAVLVADIPVGTQGSLDAALGLFAATRAAVEAKQVSGLTATAAGSSVALAWNMPSGSTKVRITGSDRPIRDVFDLRAGTRLTTTHTGSATVPRFGYYAVTAKFMGLHNEALIPGENSVHIP